MTIEGDEVVGMVCVIDKAAETVLVVSEKGYGKRSFLNDPEDGEPVYRVTNRGGKGVKTLNITEKTGPLLAIKSVNDEDDLMIITKAGITIRMHMDVIRVMGRAAQGVRLINLKGTAAIAAVARVPRSEDEEEIEDVEGLEITGENPEILGDDSAEDSETGTDIENSDVE
jgi:DNA gyrase subunit A